MANRTYSMAEAARLAAWRLTEIGRELRIARIASGRRQSDVARSIGTSTAQVSRIEHGKVPSISYRHVARFASTVGLRASIWVYPTGHRLLDKPQLELLARLRSRTSPSARWETEVPMPITGDLRAVDARLTLDGCTIAVEAFTRLADFQAQSRASLLKKRDLSATRLVLLVAATHANRRALREAAGIVNASFPLGTRAILRALAAGRDPGADGVVVI